MPGMKPRLRFFALMAGSSLLLHGCGGASAGSDGPSTNDLRPSSALDLTTAHAPDLAIAKIADLAAPIPDLTSIEAPDLAASLPDLAVAPVPDLAVSSPDLVATPDFSMLPDLTGCIGTAGIMPLSAAFGTVTNGAMNQLNAQLSNTGMCDLVIKSATIGGQNPADFSITNLPAPPFVIHGGGSVAFNLVFTASNGAQSAGLVVATDDPMNPMLQVALSGNGVAGYPMITIDIGTLNFEKVQVGTTSASSPIPILSTGQADLHISRLALIGTDPGDFVADFTKVPATMPPGTMYPITVSCQPQAMGSRTAQIEIDSDDPNHPVRSVTLACTGT